MDREELFTSSYDDSLWSFPVLINVDDQNNMGINNNNNNIVEYSEKMDVINVEATPLEETESALATATKTGGGGGTGGVERERRKKMKELYANLHALMPHLPSTADRCTMVEEAASYIKKLQETLVLLQKKKAANPNAPMMIRSAFLGSQHSSMAAINNNNRAVALANPNNLSLSPSEIKPTTFKTWTCSNLILMVCGKDAHINILCGKKKPGFLTGICCVMDKYMIELVSAEVSSDGFGSVCMIHARANVGFPIVSAEVLNVVEEIYKKAAQDIIMWLSSI